MSVCVVENVLTILVDVCPNSTEIIPMLKFNTILKR